MVLLYHRAARASTETRRMTANLALELGCWAGLVRCWLAGIASIAGSSLCGANLLRFGDHTGRALVCWGYPLRQQCHGVC